MKSPLPKGEITKTSGKEKYEIPFQSPPASDLPKAQPYLSTSPIEPIGDRVPEIGQLADFGHPSL